MKRINEILLIYTGGTIGTGQNIKTGVLESLDLHHLVEDVPEFELIQIDVDVYQFAPPVDLNDMIPTMWARLVTTINERYEHCDEFVILHGIGTIAYTASILSFVLENLTEPVMLTGSQLPIGASRTDGKENLISSIELTSAYHEGGTAIVSEAYIYSNSRLLCGSRNTEQSADGFNAFDPFNFPHLCNTGINFAYHERLILKPNSKRPMILRTHLDPHVMALSLFPGLQEDIVQRILEVSNSRGIVMRSYGGGSAPQTLWPIHLLSQATERGVIIVNVNQYVRGNVEMSRYDNGYQLQNAGVIGDYDSTVGAALTKLVFLQAQYDDYTTTCQKTKRSMAGKITLPPNVIIN